MSSLLAKHEIGHYSGNGTTQRKKSCKILDTLQEKGHFPCKILAPCEFLTRFLLLAMNYARNVKFLAQFLQVLQDSCKKGDIFRAHSVHRTCKNLQDIFFTKFNTLMYCAFLMKCLEVYVSFTVSFIGVFVL